MGGVLTVELLCVGAPEGAMRGTSFHLFVMFPLAFNNKDNTDYFFIIYTKATHPTSFHTTRL